VTSKYHRRKLPPSIADSGPDPALAILADRLPELLHTPEARDGLHSAPRRTFPLNSASISALFALRGSRLGFPRARFLRWRHGVELVQGVVAQVRRISSSSAASFLRISASSRLDVDQLRIGGGMAEGLHHHVHREAEAGAVFQFASGHRAGGVLRADDDFGGPFAPLCCAISVGGAPSYDQTRYQSRILLHPKIVSLMTLSAPEILTSVRDELLGEAQASPGLLADLANLERYVAETYSARSFIEQLQDADDARRRAPSDNSPWWQCVIRMNRVIKASRGTLQC
jgi:hypothetical protein